jgi:hypothetical protein
VKNHDQPIREEQGASERRLFDAVVLNRHAPLPGCFECAIVPVAAPPARPPADME